MTSRCSECGGTTAWNDDAASEICTTCGTLTDSNQCVLTTQDYLNDPNHYNGLWDPAAPTTLKTRSNWNLAGQDQEARDRKNSYSMAAFIKSLAVSMNAASLSPRAVTLFNRAKTVGLFRWGSKAKSVAGACLAISLREANRPDSLHDIAFLLKSSPQLLSRTFISLTSALSISSTSVDPSVYISTLQIYLTTVLQEHQSESGLPSPLLKSLQPLCVRSVANTATSLCNLLARLCPPDSAVKQPAGPTSCAIFMLSLEAESRSALNSLGDLSRCLGARIHVGKGVIMARYKTIQDEIISLIEKIPWLDKYESKGGRAKVSRRLVVARGIKDVIKFHEEIFHNTFSPELQLDLIEAENKGRSGGFPTSDGLGGAGHSKLPANPHPPKRRKVHHSLDEATRFLLDPLTSSIPSPTIPSTTGNRPGSQSDSSAFYLTSYVLTAPSLADIGQQRPTRLQLLAAERGGTGEDAINDNELFAEGELEDMLRNDEEAELLREVFGWNGEEGESVPEAQPVAKRRKTDPSGSGANDVLPQPRVSRVNMEALTRFMYGSNNEAEDDKGGDDDLDMNLLGLEYTFYDDKQSEDGDCAFSVNMIRGHSDTPGAISTTSHTLKPQTEEEIVLDAWRPMTPDRDTDVNDRYDEDPG